MQLSEAEFSFAIHRRRPRTRRMDPRSRTMAPVSSRTTMTAPMTGSTRPSRWSRSGNWRG